MELNNEELLVKTSDGKEPEGCNSYDYKNAYCKDTNKPCDMCFSKIPILKIKRGRINEKHNFM